jgi:hypothetical protein
MARFCLFISAILLLAISSCKKDHFDLTVTTESALTPLAKNTTDLLAPSGTSYPNYHGLYIDSSSYILGDANQEEALLNWCKQHEINTLSFYDLRRVMTTGKAGHLASFLRRARLNYGILETTAVVGSEAFITSYLDTFNRSKVDTLQRFTTVNLEKEWWNGDGTFKKYISSLSKLKQWSSLQQPVVKTEEYIGWFLNPSGKEHYMANELVKYSDRILVHDYQRTPSFGYVQSRLDYIGRAAKAQGKVFPVVIIFSAEPEFSADYFRINSFENAYQIILNGYLNTDFPGKNNIKLIGYQVFDQSYARGLKPMVLL